MHEVKQWMRTLAMSKQEDHVILGMMNRAWFRKSNVLIHTEHQSCKKQVRSRTVDT